MQPVKCQRCEKEFMPKPMGHNARYCSKSCKERVRRSVIKEEKTEQLQAARRRSYQKTKAHPDRLKKHRDSGRRHRKRAREWLAEYKMQRGCIDCGYRRHFSALQLDHEGPKSCSIAHARSSIRRLEEEIKNGKCQVRCANCHSIKTWERKQKLKGLN